ncbi:MAG: hypothetical protein C5B58_09375 [Acidobacteria bacterium]|nr:MAG: hypothetical protein C5B58_09375 [Acidobacteriota bacterium]
MLPDWKNPTPPAERSIVSAEDAAHLFPTVRPKLGVIYHHKDEDGLGDAVRKEYKGPFVVAKDLMVINIGKTVSWACEPAAQAPKTRRWNINAGRASQRRIAS